MHEKQIGEFIRFVRNNREEFVRLVVHQKFFDLLVVHWQELHPDELFMTGTLMIAGVLIITETWPPMVPLHLK